MRKRGIVIDYDALVTPRPSLIYDEMVSHLIEQLPELWQKAYRKMAQSPTRIHSFSHGGYAFLFDRASELRARGVVSGDRAVEDRIIVAYGRAQASNDIGGNDCRKNLLGDSSHRFGENHKRPYLKGTVLGGCFDISLYPQHRDLESERSSEARTYRAMKRYCKDYPGIFAFTRLIYGSRSWRPSGIEHGLLKQDGSMWTHVFKNAAMESRFSLQALRARTARREAAEATSAD